MSSLTVRASGPATPSMVGEAYADPQRWAEWAPHIQRVNAIGRLRPGLEGQVYAPLLPGVKFVVTEVDAKSRRWSWDAEFGPIRLSFDHGVESQGAGSATWLTMHGRMPLLVLYAPLARFALHRLVHTGIDGAATG